MSRSALRAINPRQLCEIWRAYAEFRRPQVAPSTYARDYRKIERRMELIKAAAPHLETSIQVRDWLLSRYSAEIARRTLIQINAAYTWAMESDLVTTNPFNGLPRHIRPPKPSDRAWASFTVDERDRIIQEFDQAAPYYGPWVKFLFWTGCRPEEAAALRWEHISHDCREVFFCEALPVDVSEPQTTKNGKVTRFPCNARLQHLIRSIGPVHANRSHLVFQARTGGRFNYHNFQTRYWKPIVSTLAETGEIAFYLTQYHARHTWITEALNHLPVSDVAYLARVSPSVIYKHYAGRSRRIIIPEF